MPATELALSPSALLPFAKMAPHGATSTGERRQGFVALGELKSYPNTTTEQTAVTKRVQARTNDTRGNLQIGRPQVDVLTRDERGSWRWITSTNQTEEERANGSTSNGHQEVIALSDIASTANGSNATPAEGEGAEVGIVEETSTNGTASKRQIRSQRYPGTRVAGFDWESMKPFLSRHRHWAVVEAKEQAVPSTDNDVSHDANGWDPYEVLDRAKPEGACTVFQAVLPVSETQMEEYLKRESQRIERLGKETTDAKHHPDKSLAFESGMSMQRDLTRDRASGRGMLVTIFGADTSEDAQEFATTWVKGVGIHPSATVRIDQADYPTFYSAFDATVTSQSDPDPIRGAPGLPISALQRATPEIPETDLTGIVRFNRSKTALNQPSHLQQAVAMEPASCYPVGIIVDQEDGEHGVAYADAREAKMHKIVLGATGSGKTLLLLSDVAGYVTSAPEHEGDPARSAVYVTRKQTAAGEVPEEQILANMLHKFNIPVYVVDLGNMDLPPVLGNPLNPQSALDGSYLSYQSMQATAFASSHGMAKETSDLTYEMWKKYVDKAMTGGPDISTRTTTNRFGRHSETGKPKIDGTNPPFSTPLHLRYDIRRAAEEVGYTSSTETGQTARWVDSVASQLSTGLLLHAMEGSDLAWKKVFSSGGVLVIKNGNMNDAERDYLIRQLMIRMQFELPRLKGQGALIAFDEAASVLTNKDTGEVIGAQVGIIRQAEGAIEAGTTNGSVVPQIENNMRTKVFMGSQGEGNQRGVEGLSGVGTLPREMIGELATFRPGEALMLTPGANEPVRIFTTDITQYVDGTAPELQELPEHRAPLHSIEPLLTEGKFKYPFSLEQMINLKEQLFRTNAGNAFTRLIEKMTINSGLGFNRLVVSTNKDLKAFWKKATEAERTFFLDGQIDISVDNRTEYFQQLGDPLRAEQDLPIIQLDEVKQIIREKVVASLEDGAIPSEQGDYDRRLVIPGFEGILPKAIVIDHASSNPTKKERELGNNNEYQIVRPEYPPEKLAEYLNGEVITGIDGQDPVAQANKIQHKEPTGFILPQDTRSAASIIERTLGSTDEAFSGGRLQEWLVQFELQFINEVATSDPQTDIIGSLYIFNAVTAAVEARVRAKKVDNPALSLIPDGISPTDSGTPGDKKMDALIGALVGTQGVTAQVIGEALREVGEQIAVNNGGLTAALTALRTQEQQQGAITAALITEMQGAREQLFLSRALNVALAEKLGITPDTEDQTAPNGKAATGGNGVEDPQP
jgi:hypothetical protein